MHARERTTALAMAVQDPEATFTPSLSAESVRIMAEARRVEGAAAEDRPVGQWRVECCVCVGCCVCMGCCVCVGYWVWDVVCVWDAVCV